MIKINWIQYVHCVSYIYLCWRKLSGRLKCLPHTSHEKAISGLLWVRSWIIRLYDFVNLRWQYLQTYSHFGRILRRKSSLSIFNTVNILKLLFLFLLLLLLTQLMTLPLGRVFCFFFWFFLSKILLLPQNLCCIFVGVVKPNQWSAELSRIVMIFICFAAPICTNDVSIVFFCVLLSCDQLTRRLTIVLRSLEIKIKQKTSNK